MNSPFQLQFLRHLSMLSCINRCARQQKLLKKINYFKKKNQLNLKPSVPSSRVSRVSKFEFFSLNLTVWFLGAISRSSSVFLSSDFSNWDSMNDQSQIMGQSQILQNHQNYVVWSQRPPPFPPDNVVMFQSSISHQKIFNAPSATSKPPGRANWKGKQPDKRKEFWRNEPLGPVLGYGYKPPNQSDSQAQNRLKGRRFHPKKKFNTRFAPFAPRNTTSYLIRAKKSGGITSLVSPCPVTPAILPTPIFSPSREVLVDMAKEEWGVDGYGSMKGLIRLRSGSPKGDEEDDEDDDEIGGAGAGGGSSDSDVEERVEVEKRLDHDLSRFEMIYPNSTGGDEQSSSLENRVDEQDTHITQLEEENLTLKERLFLMERELEELRRRVLCLETDGGWRISRDRIGKVPQNASENNDDLTGDVCSEKSVGNGNGDGNDDGNNDDDHHD